MWNDPIMINPKIADHHLARQGCIYIRQSTREQVRFNQEHRAPVQLSGPSEVARVDSEAVRILDRKLAYSGEQATNRDDFKTLVSAVAMGQDRRDLLSASLTRGPLDRGLASLAGAVRGDTHIGVRRRWLIQSGGFQRQLFAWHEGVRLLKQSCTSFARASTEANSTRRRKVNCTFLCRPVWYSTAIGSPSSPIRKCKTRFEQSSNYLNKREQRLRRS